MAKTEASAHMRVPSPPRHVGESSHRYRPDIDGLRAIAVLSVVIYHIHAAWVPGGYTGVDIFFVISGYLITRNIWGEMTGGGFSFANFYVRRIRRIAPAFLVMTIISTIAGSLLLLPGDLLDLAQSALWGGAFSLSNVYFWRYLDASYFAESSDQVPLLHTWSLGVEEQFYLIWPALLLSATFFARRRPVALFIALVLGVSSFICAELTNVTAQKFSYYMLPARGGELMIGALLALLSGFNTIQIQRKWIASLSEATALTGFVLVAYALFGLSDASRFPGVNALFPSLGATFLILAGGMGARLSRSLLSLRPMVFVGLISYSLYLWHWPVLAFLRYFYGEVEGGRIVAALGVMVALAVLSYQYIELPARNWRIRRSKQVALLYVLPSFALCLIAAVIWRSGGLKNIIEASGAYSDGLAKVERYTAPAYKFPYNCQLSAYDAKILNNPRCILPNASGQGEPGILLWGDSEAAHYIGVIGTVAEHEGFRFRNATLSSCPPIFGGDYGNGIYKAGCSLFRPYIEQAIQGGRYRVVVISGPGRSMTHSRGSGMT